MNTESEMARETLPNRREHECVTFEFNGRHCIAGIGRYEDGRLAEVFIDCAKAGSDADTSAREAAVSASLALQHGCSVQTLRHALIRDVNGRATGALGMVLDLLDEPNQPQGGDDAK